MNDKKTPQAPEEFIPPHPKDSLTTNPKKASQGKLRVSILIFVLLLAGTAAAYAFQDTLRNTFALLTKNPSQYYVYVEKNSLQESVDALVPYVNLAPKNSAYDLSTDITFHREALDSIMQSTLGSSLSDFESSDRKPIETIGIDVLAANQNGQISETLGIRLNQINLITLEIFMDTLKQELLLRLPELNQAYLMQSLTESELISGISKFPANLPTADVIAILLNRYGNLLIDPMTKVTLEQNTSLTLDILSVNCNKLTITIDEQDRKAIAIALLAETRQDEDILALVPLFGISVEAYQQRVDDMILELQASNASLLSGQPLQMLVYINSSGKIIGREFRTEDSPAAIGYTVLAKKDYQEYHFYVKGNSGNMVIEGIGNQTKEQGAYDGTITVNCDVPSSKFRSNFSFDIKYSDVRTEIANSHLYQYGTYTLSSLELMGLQMRMENSVSSETQYNKIIFQLGASPLVTIDSTLNYRSNYAVALPPDTAEIYDAAQSERYMESLKADEYLTKLSQQFGIDLNDLLNQFQMMLPMD
jgi:hypothetical protein